MEYVRGTFLQLHPGPFACGYKRGRAMCSDGKTRAVRFYSGIADTYFSIPAQVKVSGRWVSGFVTVETEEGWTTPTDDDQAIVKFIAYQLRKNGHLLPPGVWKRDQPPIEVSLRG